MQPDFRGLKNCASFDVREPGPRVSSDEKHRKFKDPAGLDILSRVAAGLAGAGYRATKAAPAVAAGFDAAFRCRLSGFLAVDVLLAIAEHHDGRVNCRLWTIPSRPILSRFSLRKRPTDSQNAQAFQRLLFAVNDQVMNCLGATSVSWLTEKEAGDLPEPAAPRADEVS
jgi:hypothetical protein